MAYFYFRDKLGFSLIELVITLAILSVLASIVAPLTQVAVKRNKEQELTLALRTIREAIDAYKQAADEGRVNKSIDESGYPKNLELLVNGVVDMRDIKKNKIYFLRKIPQDPMLNIKKHQTNIWGLRSYSSPAEKPAAGEDVFDVYSLSNEIGLNGISYDEW